MVWGALLGAGLQLGGSYLSGNADKKEAAKQADLGRQYATAYGQYSGWQKQADEALAARMHDLSLQGYGNYSDLGQALASPARGEAGAVGAASSAGRLRMALAGTPQTHGPANVPSSAYGKWAANTTAQRYAPMLDARMNLANQQAAQRGMANYDRNALGQAADRTLDLGRQAGETQQREAALAAYRRQILDQAQVDYGYKGPSPSSYDAKMYGGMANLAGSYLMSRDNSKG